MFQISVKRANLFNIIYSVFVQYCIAKNANIDPPVVQGFKRDFVCRSIMIQVKKSVFLSLSSIFFLLFEICFKKHRRGSLFLFSVFRGLRLWPVACLIKLKSNCLCLEGQNALLLHCTSLTFISRLYLVVNTLLGIPHSLGTT